MKKVMFFATLMFASASVFATETGSFEPTINVKGNSEKERFYRLIDAIRQNNLDEVKAVICPDEKYKLTKLTNFMNNIKKIETSELDIDKIEGIIKRHYDDIFKYEKVINIQFGDYVPPLHFASGKGYLTIVKFLLKHGADINKKESALKATPLLRAVQENETETAEYLINHGADIDVVDANRDTPFYAALSNKNKVLVKCLVDHGANVDEKDSNGETPLYKAAKSGDLKKVEILIQNGANVAIKDDYGKTPLKEALDRQDRDPNPSKKETFGKIIEILKRAEKK